MIQECSVAGAPEYRVPGRTFPCASATDCSAAQVALFSHCGRRESVERALSAADVPPPERGEC